MKTSFARAAFVLLGIAAAPAASALPIMIDFTDEAWLGVTGQSSYSLMYDSLEVTLSANGPMTFNEQEAPASSPAPLAGRGDGIGVNDDEIGWGQRIDVTFGQAVTVLGYYFLDLFAGESPNGGGELAFVRFDSASFLDEGTATDDVGYYQREVAEISSIVSFFAGSDPSSITETVGLEYNDFALAGILIDTVIDSSPEPVTGGISPVDAGTDPAEGGQEPVQVPAPSALALLALGLLSLGVRSRRRNRISRDVASASTSR